jgi:S-formylglutathione hydrolase FrmB
MKNGKVVTEIFESGILKENPLHDPHTRKLPIYLPPGYENGAGARYPVIYILSGFMGFGTMLLSPQAWGYALDERCDKLIAEKKMPECIVVMPDCFTRWGGSQYMNSSAFGNYEDYVIKEIVPFVDLNYRTMARPEHRAVIGKSSGGYGALMLAMKYPEVFSTFYCSSGDMYFDYVYMPDFPKAYATIAKAGGLRGFFDGFFSARKKTMEMITAMNIIAMSAAYTPNPMTRPFGFDLPFDLETGELRETIWGQWKKFDPIRVLDQENYRNNFRKLKNAFFDCGSRDEYHLHVGARILTKKLQSLDLRYQYEEFDDGHMGTSYRYDIALPLVSRAIL